MFFCVYFEQRVWMPFTAGSVPSKTRKQCVQELPKCQRSRAVILSLFHHGHGRQKATKLLHKKNIHKRISVQVCHRICHQNLNLPSPHLLKNETFPIHSPFLCSFYQKQKTCDRNIHRSFVSGGKRPGADVLYRDGFHRFMVFEPLEQHKRRFSLYLGLHIT